MARLLFRADFDPGVIAVRAEPTSPGDADSFELARFARWATLVADAGGKEHLALSDGWRRIRVDVAQGTLLGGRPVRLHYLVSGRTGVDAHLLTLRRLLALGRHGRFVHKLFPAETGVERGIEALRVGDALATGSSYREAAVALFGEERVVAEWRARSDYLLSRVRRRAAEARHMANGGWRTLLRR